MESNNSSPEMLPEPLSLVTINDDCKELIFEYLELRDLVNIAETSKQLNTAVCSVFKRKYGTKKICYGRPYENRYEILVCVYDFPDYHNNFLISFS